MLRPLRIAVPVLSGLCCVLVIVLWVRSYYRYDFTQSTRLTSADGWIHIGREVVITRFASATLRPQQLTANALGTFSIASSGVILNLPGGGLSLPYWVLAGLTAAGAASLWLPRQFSLRILLIATTAVALLLGIITYANRG